MTPGEATPLDEATLAAAFAPLAGAASILVAVSGGPDSIALLGTLATWAGAPARPALAAATVDHALRPESRREAEAVAAFCATLGVPHAILTWHHDREAGHMQAAAREARHRLLREEAHRLGASHLALAHHQDDQAETVLMRLAAGSGPAGLAAMRPITRRGSLVIARPFLRLPKARLVATCRRDGWSFVADPSNEDRRYERTRWRALAPTLAAEGLDAERLARLADRLARVEDALARAGETVFADATRPSPEGGIALDGRLIAAEPDEIGIRVLSLALQALAGQAGQPPLRLERLETCHVKLAEAARDGRPLRRTLAGRVLTLDASGLLTIRPEPPRRRGRGSLLTLPATEPPRSLGTETLRT